METKKYESPKFEFLSMKLMERVADTCWGYHSVWFDADGDGEMDGEEEIIHLSGSCNEGEKKLEEFLNGKVDYSDQQVKTNVNDKSILKPIPS